MNKNTGEKNKQKPRSNNDLINRLYSISAMKGLLQSDSHKLYRTLDARIT